MKKYWVKICEKSRSGGIWGGLGGLSEAILDDVGSKLACLGSCWCYVAHFGQQDGCQDGHLGDQECQDVPRWRPRGCKIELRWHLGPEIERFYSNLVKSKINLCRLEHSFVMESNLVVVGRFYLPAKNSLSLVAVVWKDFEQYRGNTMTCSVQFVINI